MGRIGQDALSGDTPAERIASVRKSFVDAFDRMGENFCRQSPGELPAFWCIMALETLEGEKVGCVLHPAPLNGDNIAVIYMALQVCEEVVEDTIELYKSKSQPKGEG